MTHSLRFHRADTKSKHRPRHVVQHFRMARQVEHGLRKGSGSDLAERCDACAPPPTAYLEQRGLIATRDWYFSSGCFGMMIKFVGDEHILRRCLRKHSPAQ